MKPVWQVQLLGELRAVQGDRDVTRFRSHKAGVLLAYLALFPNRIHTREALADLLWPDSDPKSGRVSLRTVLSGLRRVLEGPGVSSGSVLITPGHTEVRLDPDAVATDVAAFEGLRRSAASPSASPEERISRLSQAVSLYRGPLLPGFQDVWALAERSRLAAEFIRALRSLSSAYEEIGDLGQAISFARQATATDPLSERSRTDLIRLLAASGDRLEALRQFQEVERLLQEQMNAVPSAELRNFVDTLKDGPSAAAPKSSLPNFAIAPARNRLPGEPVPNSAHRDDGSGTPARSSIGAPVRPDLSGVRYLPPTFTPFFGRENESAALAERLVSGTTRFVTVTGPAGSGKTRLVVETVRPLEGHFQGGIVFVPLAEVRSPEHIAVAIAQALGLSASTSTPPLEQVIESLQGAGGPNLLVLDNFEQLAGVGGVEVLSVLLSRLPSLKLLVTSRLRLHLEMEQEFPLFALPFPDLPGTPERLLDFPSVQLFVSRARASRPDFQITARNAEAIAQLCARLEGIPLAIELAAAWSQTLTPAQMLDRLGKRFDLLVSRRRDIPRRHSTLRAAIQWSWELLSEDLRVWFSRLSVFSGGWTLEAAERVCEIPDTLTVLAELRDHSLLVAQEETEDRDTAGMRYRLLESLREFGKEQVNPEERFRLQSRHADYYLCRAEEGAPFNGGSHDQRVRLDYLQAEQLNFRAALGWTREVADLKTDARQSDALSRHLRLCVALWDFWFLRGHLGDAARWLLTDSLVTQLSSESDDFGVDSAVLARFFHARAQAAQSLGDTESFVTSMERAICWYRKAGDRSGEGRAMARLARHCHSLPYPERRQMARRARRLCRDADDRWAQAEVLADQAWIVRWRVEHYPRAHQMMARAVELYRSEGDEEHVVAVLREQGTWYAWACQIEQADRQLREALSLARRQNNQREIGFLLWILGYNTAYAGNLESASELLAEGVRTARAMGDPFCLLLNLNQQALVHLGRGDDHAAEDGFRDCVPRCRRIGENSSRRYTLPELFLSIEGLAIIAGARGDLRRAARLLGLAWAHGRPGPEEPAMPNHPPGVRERYTHLRALLRDSAEEFRADWDWGKSLDPTQADRFILYESPPA